MKNKLLRFYISYLFECVAMYINARYYLWAIFYKRKQARQAKRYQVESVEPEVYGPSHIQRMKSLERDDTLYIRLALLRLLKKYWPTVKECVTFS